MAKQAEIVTERAPRILVYHIGNLGDTVAGVPALRVIRRRYGSGAKICLLHDRGRAEVVSGSEVLAGCGLVDCFLEYRRGPGLWGSARAALGLWSRLVRQRFDAVVYLMQSERPASSVRRDELFFTLCGIRQRLGFEAFPREFLYPRDANGAPQVVEHESIRLVSRLQKAGFEGLRENELDEPCLRASEADSKNSEQWLNSNRRYPDRTLVAFCPGSKMTAKVWPQDRFAEIGRRLLANGRFEIVVVGGPAESGLAEYLIGEWGYGVNAAGRFSVPGSAALLGRCRFTVTLDSGPMHLAAAMGTPCVALFSSVDYPGRYHPLGRGHILLRHSVPCAGCRLQACPVEGHPCMTGITIEEAWQSVERLCDSLALPLTHLNHRSS